MATFIAKVARLYSYMPTLAYRAQVLDAIEYIGTDKLLTKCEKLGCETRECIYCQVPNCPVSQQAYRSFCEQLSIYFKDKISACALAELFQALSTYEKEKVRKEYEEIIDDYLDDSDD